MYHATELRNEETDGNPESLSVYVYFTIQMVADPSMMKIDLE